jgi:hypothetical protein
MKSLTTNAPLDPDDVPPQDPMGLGSHDPVTPPLASQVPAKPPFIRYISTSAGITPEVDPQWKEFLSQGLGAGRTYLHGLVDSGTYQAITTKARLVKNQGTTGLGYGLPINWGGFAANQV